MILTYDVESDVITATAPDGHRIRWSGVIETEAGLRLVEKELRDHGLIPLLAITQGDRMRQSAQRRTEP